MTIEARILKNSFLLTAQPLFLNVVSVFAIAYIARVLGVVDFGILNMAVLFSTFFYPIGELGLRNVAIREISSIRDERDLVRGYVEKNLPLRASLALVMMAILMGSAVCMHYSERLTLAIFIAGMILVFQLLSEATCDLFAGFEKMEYTALTSLVSGLALTVFSVLVLFAGYGLYEVIGAYAAGQFIGLGVAVFFLLKLLSTVRFRLDFGFWKKQIRRGLPFIGMSLMWAAITRMDTLFLSKITSAENLGYYTTAMLLVTKICIIPEALSAAIFPAVSKLYSGKNTPEMDAIFKKFITISLLLALPICIETSVFSTDIIGMIFGNRYVQASFVLRYAIWALLLRCVMFIQFAMLAATHNEIKATRGYVLALVSSLALNFALTYLYQLPGAVAAFLATQLLLLLSFSWSTVRTLHMHPDWQRILMLLVLNALLLAFLYASKSLPFLVAVSASIPVYLVGLFLFRIITLAEVFSLVKIPKSA